MRRNKDKEAVYIDGTLFYVPPEVKRYIDEYIQTNKNLLDKNWSLEQQLERIKPIVEDKKLKPALSRNCSGCKYVVKSSWNGEPLKCCRDSVCEDYTPKE